jgi:LysM repeat protein
MKGILVLALAGLVGLSACSLSSAEQTDDATPTAIVQIVTATSLPAGTATQRPASATPAPTQAPQCVVRSDWLTYRVVSGDTLFTLAQRTNSTVNELVVGNCLTNANNLITGQDLRVPRAPVSNQPPPTIPPAPQQVGGVTVSQIINGDAGFVTLVRDANDTLEWEALPASAGIVLAEFLLLPTDWRYGDPLNDVTEIGTDNTPADGFSVIWGTIPPNLQHQLAAFGYRTDASLGAYSFPITVFSAALQGQGCAINPNVAMNYFGEPHGDDSTPDGSVGTETTLYPLGRSLGGWWAISTNVPQSGVGGVDALKWLPVDADVTANDKC